MNRTIMSGLFMTKAESEDFIKKDDALQCKWMNCLY